MRSETAHRSGEEAATIFNDLNVLNTSARTTATDVTTNPELNPRISIQVVPFMLGIYDLMETPYSLARITKENGAIARYAQSKLGETFAYGNTDRLERQWRAAADLAQRIPGPDQTAEMLNAI